MAVNTGATYSPPIGFIFIFNLIVGTGALTLPAAFAGAGWIISLCVILALGVISYITLTFVVESMAVANAVLRSRRAKEMRKKEQESYDPVGNDTDSVDSSSSSSPTKSLLETVKRVRHKKRVIVSSPRLLYSDAQPGGSDELPDVTVSPSFADGERMNNASTAKIVDIDDGQEDVEDCDIQETVEMGKMAAMFFNKTGTILFFICIAIYLYGDLAIYAAAVGKSLRDAFCTYHPIDVPCNETLPDSIECWEDSGVTRYNAYRLFLSIFVIIIGSFGFFNVQKTLLLQILTTLVRWTAFITMIALAFIRLSSSPPEDLGHPPAADISGVPNLFGACVYSFMCHHSLPSLITPIKPKKSLYKVLIGDYVLIAGFYLLLGFSGIFAFPQLEDLYTLNFVPDRCPVTDPSDNTTMTSSVLLSMMPKESVSTGQQILFYFLTLFPVFTLSTSYPIITITLRNNLKQLFLRREESEYSFFIRRLFFPFLAIIPPTIIALITSNISFLVGITGSYAGAGVQYVVPAMLAYYARKDLMKEFPNPAAPARNAFASPFKHVAFVWFTIAWSVACIGFVTYNHIATGK